MSPPDQREQGPCALCGRSGAEFVVGGPPVCERCQLRLDSAKAKWPSFLTMPLPPDERYEELFKAARVLLRERVSDVERIIPTLAFAHELGRGFFHLPAEKKQMEYFASYPEAWKQAADRFAQEYHSRPIKVVDGVLILERLPMCIDIRYQSNTHVAEKVIMSILPSYRLTEPEQLGSLYEKTLSDAGIPHEEIYESSIAHTFEQGALFILIGPGPRLSGTDYFPHPQHIEESYLGLLRGPSRELFARCLGTHESGDPPHADNLIPACVAFYLSRTRIFRKSRSKIRPLQNGEDKVNRMRGVRHKVNRQTVHQLLNEHVFCEIWKALPLGGCSATQTDQLWRDAKKFGLVASDAADAFCTDHREAKAHL